MTAIADPRATDSEDAPPDPGFLRELWYLVLPGGRLPRGRLVAKTVLGEPLVLGRGADGAPFALRDICPHRGIPLSCGRLERGEIECAYHGWRFDAAGCCTAIPSLVEDQPFQLSRVKVAAYPCREVQGNVWVFFGKDPAGAPEIPRVADVGEGGPRIAESMLLQGPIDHAVVGLMDPAHGPFVHRSWWWRSRASIHAKAKRFEPSPLGFTMVRHRASSNSRAYRLLGGVPETEIVFRLPSIRIEHVRAGRHVLGGLTAVTPLGPRETEIHHLIYWTMPWLTALRPLLRPFVRSFLGQDRDIMAKQQIGLAHAPPLLLIDDADRPAKWYYRLKNEYARATAERRPFVNPVKPRELRWRS
ncbi:MAG: aromatic ring-hydroxylating dioxygenase subunit alpha [Alphaproteobacteria bacterium]|nr:aromatic ring-hydroxylating dioxygenase subunit alpha [Alphaproteobacteria bacterium]